MAFVRKPKPYTRGRGAARFPSQASSAFDWRWPEMTSGARRPRGRMGQPARVGGPRLTPLESRPAQVRRKTTAEATQVGPAFRPLAQPAWFTALATVGGAVCLLLGGSLLLNQFSREAQFQGMAQHLMALHLAQASGAAEAP